MISTVQGILQLSGNKIHMNHFKVIFLTDVFAGLMFF